MNNSAPAMQVSCHTNLLLCYESGPFSMVSYLYSPLLAGLVSTYIIILEKFLYNSPVYVGGSMMVWMRPWVLQRHCWFVSARAAPGRSSGHFWVWGFEVRFRLQREQEQLHAREWCWSASNSATACYFHTIVDSLTSLFLSMSIVKVLLELPP